MAVAKDFVNVTKNTAGDVSVRYQSTDNSPAHVRQLQQYERLFKAVFGLSDVDNDADALSCYADLVEQIVQWPCYEVKVSRNQSAKSPNKSNGDSK